ncbi:MAG: ParB/RepB/Spo0J family partition protein [Tissierellia bacterium]|nr:ParB/RepB/Spo0J family partition protein [Tissierellia bacterium]
MAGKKRGLGKGLAALIPEDPISSLLNAEVDKESISNIELELIEPNEEQPRKEFEKESLEQLKDSIKEHGVIQPILVRKKGNKYEIIAGERRWRAAKAAKLKEIPCIIMEADDKKALKLALIENLQRENLNPIEEAHAYRSLIEEYNMTQEEVAQTIGKSRSYISNTIRLLNLDKEIIDYISKGQITSGHGRALLGIKNKEERLKAAKLIVEEKINVRQIEDMAKNKEKAKSKKKALERDPFIQEIEESLMRVLGTKVKLTLKKNGGKIEIDFYSNEDLDRIIESIVK